MRKHMGEISDGIALPIPCRPDKIPLRAGVQNLAQGIDIVMVFHDAQGVSGVEIGFFPAGREVKRFAGRLARRATLPHIGRI
jgi:hypothetical protein